MENKETITIIDETGKEIPCEVLFTFELEETKKSYIVYTDNTLDENGNTKVYASIFNPDEETVSNLEPITSEREWKVIEKILESIQEEAKKQLEGEQGE